MPHKVMCQFCGVDEVPVVGTWKNGKTLYGVSCDRCYRMGKPDWRHDRIAQALLVQLSATEPEPCEDDTSGGYGEGELR